MSKDSRWYERRFLDLATDTLRVQLATARLELELPADVAGTGYSRSALRPWQQLRPWRQLPITRNARRYYRRARRGRMKPRALGP